MNRLLCFAVLMAAFAAPVFAEPYRPDDTVTFNLAAEDWVTTKTAHVTLDLEASVSAADAGAMRADMTKAVDSVAKGDWKLTGFSRNQDQTGLERWSAHFETRLPENELNGLADAARKSSKPGLQVTVSGIDFTPTLEETEAARAALRTKLVKQANDQLASLNSTLSGRTYRIAQLDFSNDGAAPPVPHPVRRIMMAAKAAPMADADTEGSLERSEKITVGAEVVYAALPPTPASH